MIWTILLVALLLVSSIGWLVSHIGALTLACWIEVNCDNTPNEIEIKECMQTVIRRLLGLK